MAEKKRKTSRRANNEGSIYKRQDGSWCAQVTIGYDEKTGKIKRKTLYGKTQEEVRKKKEAALLQLRLADPSRPMPNPTVELFMKDFLLNVKKESVTSRTFEWYCNLAEIHIYPTLGSTPLNSLTLDSLQVFLNGMMARKLSLRTVKAVRDLLNQALEYACQTKLLNENPVRYARLPKFDRSVSGDEKEALSPELRKRVLDAAKSDEVMYPILLTLMFTGMRAGEALALIWKNVDLEKGLITVDRAVTQESTYDKEGKRLSRETIVAMPKTQSGIRRIPLLPQVVDTLATWKKYVEGKHPEWVGPDKPVFMNQSGEQRTYSGFRATYRHFLKRNGLEDEHLNLHRYRHTFATILLEMGANPRTVQMLMGHRDVKTTLGTYSHVSMGVLEDAVAGLNGALTQLLGGEKPAENEEKSAV